MCLLVDKNRVLGLVKADKHAPGLTGGFSSCVSHIPPEWYGSFKSSLKDAVVYDIGAGNLIFTRTCIEILLNALAWFGASDCGLTVKVVDPNLCDENSGLDRHDLAVHGVRMTWHEFVKCRPAVSPLSMSTQLLSCMDNDALVELVVSLKQVIMPGGLVIMATETLDQVTEVRHRGLRLFQRGLEEYVRIFTKNGWSFVHASVEPAHYNSQAQPVQDGLVMGCFLFANTIHQ